MSYICFAPFHIRVQSPAAPQNADGDDVGGPGGRGDGGGGGDHNETGGGGAGSQ